MAATDFAAFFKKFPKEQQKALLETLRAAELLFPASGSIAANMGSALDKYVVSKGTIHFDIDKPFPKALLKKVLLSRLEQINGSYPKASGVFIEYYKNGGIKAEGKYKGKVMNGVWTTYDSKGRIVKTTKF